MPHLATPFDQMLGSGARYRGGRGTALLLLHPVMTSWRAWRPLLPALSAVHHVIAPTLAGYRWGPVWPCGRPIGVETPDDLLEEDLDRDGLSRVHIAGMDLGGRLALGLASRGRAKSVVAFRPAVPPQQLARSGGAAPAAFHSTSFAGPWIHRPTPAKTRRAGNPEFRDRPDLNIH